jgi:hypothetical protein
MQSNYGIVLCELFHPEKHGFCPRMSDPAVIGHYLVRHKYGPTNIHDLELGEDNEDEDYVADAAYLNDFIRATYSARMKHPAIRNYRYLVANIKPEIAQCFYMAGDECVAVLKTFWLRLIQRAWKRIFQQRSTVKAMRLCLASTRHRELHGFWPRRCQMMPSIQGMLCSLRTEK